MNKDQQVKFIDLEPSAELRVELDEAYHRVMASGRYIDGPEVEAFEYEWADYCWSGFCVSCGNGQGALELLLRAYDIGQGDTVIVPSWTASATWKAVLAVGAFVHPIDRFEAGSLMSPDKANSDLRYAKAIIPVHLYGRRCYTDFDFPVIEDVCQAHGLKDLGNAAFSFYPTKNLGTYGDAGAIVTNEEKIAEECKKLRNSNRLDELQAAFLQVKLKYLGSYNLIRWTNAGLYEEHLTDKIDKPPDTGVYHQYVIRSDNRNDLRIALAKRGIETMIHYPMPPHRELGLDFDLPVADELSRTVLSLPIMTEEKNIYRVIEAINELA